MGYIFSYSVSFTSTPLPYATSLFQRERERERYFRFRSADKHPSTNHVIKIIFKTKPKQTDKKNWKQKKTWNKIEERKRERKGGREGGRKKSFLYAQVDLKVNCDRELCPVENGNSPANQRWKCVKEELFASFASRAHRQQSIVKIRL